MLEWQKKLVVSGAFLILIAAEVCCPGGKCKNFQCIDPRILIKK